VPQLDEVQPDEADLDRDDAEYRHGEPRTLALGPSANDATIAAISRRQLNPARGSGREERERVKINRNIAPSAQLTK
jgi:hypothetical protein